MARGWIEKEYRDALREAALKEAALLITLLLDRTVRQVQILPFRVESGQLTKYTTFALDGIRVYDALARVHILKGNKTLARELIPLG